MSRFIMFTSGAALALVLGLEAYIYLRDGEPLLLAAGVLLMLPAHLSGTPLPNIATGWPGLDQVITFLLKVPLAVYLGLICFMAARRSLVREAEPGSLGYGSR